MRARSPSSASAAAATTASASSSPDAIRNRAFCRSKCSSISRKFSRCGPAITGLPKIAGSRMLCPPRSASVPPMNTTRLARNNPLNSPIESSSSTSAHRSSIADRRVHRSPAAASFPATRSNRSGFRGARINRHPANRFWASMTKSSSSICSSAEVLAAIQIGPSAARNSSICGANPPAGAAKSYFRFPPTATNPGAAPAAINRRRISSDCTRIRSHKRSTHRNRPDAARYRGSARSEIRPFTITSPHSTRFASRNRFGQISVSRITTTLGRRCRSTRRTAQT